LGKKINSYFDDRAANYQDKSNRGIWGYFRKKERGAIVRLLEPKAHSSLLDLGSGAGYYSLYFKEKHQVEVVAIDSSSAMIEQLKKRGISCYQLSIEDLNFLPSFDNALAAGVLEFIESPEKFFNSISSRVKPGGRLVILIPSQGFIGWAYRIIHAINGCPSFIRRSSEYEKLAALYGFKVIGFEGPTIISKAICFEKN
jgi:SAM-dependent methyltransferase